MTLYYSVFEPAPLQYVSVHPAVFGGYLAFTWTALPDGTWEQSRPEPVPSMDDAVSLVPPGSIERPAPPEFAERFYEVRS